MKGTAYLRLLIYPKKQSAYNCECLSIQKKSSYCKSSYLLNFLSIGIESRYMNTTRENKSETLKATCMYVCISVYVRARTHICRCLSMHICARAHAYVYMYVSPATQPPKP